MSLFFKKFPPPSLIYYYANPKALKQGAVRAEAQTSGVNVAISSRFLYCLSEQAQSSHSQCKKNSDFLPLLKRRKTVSIGRVLLVPLRLASLWQVDSLM
jgi:hypothetical protein